jgi:hypothetical protein
MGELQFLTLDEPLLTHPVLVCALVHSEVRDTAAQRGSCLRSESIFARKKKLMTIRNIIITHRAINEALMNRSSGGLESLEAPEVMVLRQLAAHLREEGRSSAAEVAAFSEALAELQKAQSIPDILTSVQHRTASLLQSYLAENAVKPPFPPPDEGGFEARFDDHDILGWVGSFFTWWRGLKKHKWLPPPQKPDDFGAALRVGVLGDWGTGLYGAPACAHSLQNDPKGYGLFLHLGDVYYSGTEKEVQERFLDLWPQRSGTLSRALNSNHEMYTGGHAYFKKSLKKFGQSSSCFAMKNDNWLLVGLDSAYEEHDLAKNQEDWLAGLAAAHPEQKVVLFSHHQPFSLFDGQGPKLVAKLNKLLESRRIFAWYWGHEHRCVIYDEHPLWGLRGRCIGHGGYPYFRTDVGGSSPVGGIEGFRWYRLPSRNLVPGGLVLDGPNRYVEGHEEKYGPNGYATLEFSGEHLTEFVHTPDGRVIHDKQLV